MRITHICLSGTVTDGWTYQENLLSKYHVKNGHEVTFITSEWQYGVKGNWIKSNNLVYTNADGVKMVRMKLKGLPNFNKKLKIYSGLYNEIVKSKPQIIFIHGCQFINIKNVVKYAERNKDVKIFVDNHADFSNSATNWLSMNFLHKKIWKYCATLIEPYTTKFYGVTPARVNFLIDIYKLPKKKVELLVMGVDDERVEEIDNSILRDNIREKFNITSNDFLIVTGGKIDNSKKQILLLMKAIKNISKENIKLLIFGSIIPELQEEFDQLIDHNRIQYVGWIDSNESYNYFAASDIVVFPGRHSVFWEQVVGQGIPMIIKYWKGTTHVDIGGNILYLKHDSVNEIEETILKVYSHPEELNKMKKVAKEKGMYFFSYNEISKRSIEED